MAVCPTSPFRPDEKPEVPAQLRDLNAFLEKELALEGILGTVVTIVIGPYKRCPWTGI